MRRQNDKRIGSSVWLEYMPVTHGVASSSLVRSAKETSQVIEKQTCEVFLCPKKCTKNAPNLLAYKKIRRQQRYLLSENKPSRIKSLSPSYSFWSCLSGRCMVSLCHNFRALCMSSPTVATTPFPAREPQMSFLPNGFQ